MINELRSALSEFLIFAEEHCSKTDISQFTFNEMFLSDRIQCISINCFYKSDAQCMFGIDFTCKSSYVFLMCT